MAGIFSAQQQLEPAQRNVKQAVRACSIYSHAHTHTHSLSLSLSLLSLSLNTHTTHTTHTKHTHTHTHGCGVCVCVCVHITIQRRSSTRARKYGVFVCIYTQAYIHPGKSAREQEIQHPDVLLMCCECVANRKSSSRTKSATSSSNSRRRCWYPATGVCS